MRLGAFFGALSICALGAPEVGQADVLTITAKGTIASSCSVGVQQAFGVANFNAAGSAGAQALVNCNTGFRINVTSANGAAKTANVTSNGFTNSLPYSVKLDLPLDDNSTVSATCASSALVSGQSSCALSPANGTGLSSGGKTAINKIAALTATWTLPAQPLVAGSYSDTLTVSIASVP